MLGAIGAMAAGVPGLGEENLVGGIVGGILNPISGLVGAIGKTAVVPIAAISGSKQAQGILAAEHAQKMAELQVAAAQAQGQATSARIQAWAPWVAIGGLGLGMVGVFSRMAGSRRGR